MDVNTVIIAGGAIHDVDAEFGGGVTIPMPPNQSFSITSSVRITVSPNGHSGVLDVNGRPMQQSPADVLMHEVETHGEPSMTGRPQTLQNENEDRRELGKPERALDPYHPQ
jgi:hypothetical protein